MGVVELDVAHEHLAAVESHLADGAGVRVPVVHGRRREGRIGTSVGRRFGLCLVLEVRLKSVAEVDPAVIDEVGLGVEGVVADEAPGINVGRCYSAVGRKSYSFSDVILMLVGPLF